MFENAAELPERCQQTHRLIRQFALVKRVFAANKCE